MAESPAFPERLHVSVLVLELFARLEATMTEWLDWTEDVVRKWDSCASSPARRRWAVTYLRDLADEIERRRAQTPRPR